MSLMKDNLEAFAAYSRLTVVARARAEIFGHETKPGKADYTFQEFLDMMEEDEVVDASLARKVDDWQIYHSQLQKQYKRSHAFENETFNYIEKAYQLGLVNNYGVLYKNGI